jgi:rfaE bifunctional protein nucleotidyltransferase chain/domain
MQPHTRVVGARHQGAVVVYFAEAVPAVPDVTRAFVMSTRSTLPKFLADVHVVERAFAPQRAAGKTLVTTNGCFDILHAGHVQYLSAAAALGDLLVVGVNCDDVVRRQKGADRPLQSEGDRCCILAALEMVDAVFIFREDDPREFLSVLRPDVHVKGGDYDAASMIERGVVKAHGGMVFVVPLLAGRSTSAIVRRLNAGQIPLERAGEHA